MAKKPVQIPVEFSVENIAELRKQIESITPKDQREGVRRTQALASLDKISKVGDRQLSLDEAKNYLKEWRSAEKFVWKSLENSIKSETASAVKAAKEEYDKRKQAVLDLQEKAKKLVNVKGNLYTSREAQYSKIMEQTGGKGIIGPSGSALDMQQIAYYIKQFGSRGADASVAGSYAATVKKSFEAGGGDYDLFVKQIKEATVYLPQYNQELKQAIAQLPEAQAQQEKAQAELEAAKTTLGTDELAKPVVDFGKALDELSRKIHELSQSSTAPQTSMDTKEIGVTDEEANKANKNLNNITKTVTKQDNAVSKLIKNYFGYRAALRLLQRITKTSTQAIIQFDKALTEQAMVSGQTREQTYKLLNTYQELAKLLGATTTEVASVATEYFRQGKSANEALKLTEAAVSAAKVASISTSESVNYLTTAINGFRLSADDAITVSDKFAALAASSATSYQELAIALSKVASQANLAGMSMDYTLGLLATGIEATRESAESIGTALKTVIARMRELTDYGKTLDDNETLNNVEKQLQYVGVALRNAQGELRSTEEVLDEIGQAWNTYSSNQQAAIAKALAGTRQQSRLISILDNYDRTLELVSISEQSAGATAAQLSVYMEGLGAATNSLSTAWMQLTSSFVNSDWLISTINKLSIFISYLGQCQDLLPKIIIFLLAMGAANLANSIATASAAAAEGKRQAGLVGSVVALISNTKATNANTAAKVANTSATLGLIGAGIGVTAVIGLGITAIVKWNKAQNKNNNAVNNSVKKMNELQTAIYNTTKTINSIDTAINKFDKLDKQVIKTKDDIDEMNEALSSVRDTIAKEDWEKVMGSGTYAMLSAASGAELKRYLQEYREALSEQRTASYTSAVGEAERFGGFAAYYELMTQRGKSAAAVAALNAQTSLLTQGKGYSVAQQNTISEALGLLSNAELADLLDDNAASLATFADILDIFSDTNEEIMSKGTFSEQLEMYRALKNEYGENSTALELLTKKYPILINLDEDLGASMAELMDKYQMSATTLNNLANETKEFNKKAGTNIKWTDVLQDLVDGGAWEDIAAKYGLMGDQAKQFYNVLESGTTTLTQALVESATTLENSAKNLRESQANWATLTDAEKRQIMEDNADLFGDKDFYNAFVNGQDITSYLQKANRDTIAFIQQEAAKLYRAAEAQGDYGTMQLLKQYLKAESEYLTLSLSDLVENENKQLDIIKDTLEKERDLLKENLKKRRDAYQDYYDKLNKMQEVQDYESERTKIVQQMTRLGGATDATSANKLLELQKQLTELDKEYRTTTVTNAQDAVLDGLDNQIDKLDEYYSDLLDNNQKMLEMYSDNYKALLIEQANLLALSGETSNSIANNLISFTRILGIDISDISLPELTGNTTTTTTTNNSYIFNGQVNSNVDSFMQEVFNAMKKYGLNLGGAK